MWSPCTGSKIELTVIVVASCVSWNISTRSSTTMQVCKVHFAFGLTYFQIFMCLDWWNYHLFILDVLHIDKESYMQFIWIYFYHSRSLVMLERSDVTQNTPEGFHAIGLAKLTAALYNTNCWICNKSVVWLWFCQQNHVSWNVEDVGCTWFAELSPNFKNCMWIWGVG